MEQIFMFLTEPGNGDRVLGLVITSIIVLGIISVLIHQILDIIFNFLKTFINMFKINRKDRIVEVPTYITPPENKEIDKYLAVLKKIVTDHNSGIKL
jgi:hypothetical protein